MIVNSLKSLGFQFNNIEAKYNNFLIMKCVNPINAKLCFHQIVVMVERAANFL